MKKKCLCCVAIGEKYVLQTKKMIDSFLLYNRFWDVKTFFDDDLVKILPDQCKDWNDFNKCEIGRWFAIKKCLNDYDTVLYSDGDMRFYDAYETGKRPMVLFPHYVTDFAKRSAKHFLMKDGIANLGLVEMSKCYQNEEIFDFIIGEVLHKPDYFKHGENLWLQNLVSYIPECGFDCTYNYNAGYDVAAWNLRKMDREVIQNKDGKFIVRTNLGKEFPLVCFHFSSKSLHRLDLYGEAVSQLKKDFLS